VHGTLAFYVWKTKVRRHVSPLTLHAEQDLGPTHVSTTGGPSTTTSPNLMSATDEGVGDSKGLRYPQPRNPCLETVVMEREWSTCLPPTESRRHCPLMVMGYTYHSPRDTQSHQRNVFASARGGSDNGVGSHRTRQSQSWAPPLEEEVSNDSWQSTTSRMSMKTL
jgi:hypothetical protein